MGCLVGGGGAICGGIAKLTKRKPKNWFDDGYTIFVKYPFKWRVKIGKVECNCKKVEEHYQPYYGRSWFHTEDCLLMQLVKKRPQLLNLPCYEDLPLITTD